MHVYRVLYTDDTNDYGWIDDPNICTKTYKPLNVRLYHYPGCDEISAITAAKLFLFDTGLCKATLNFVIQSFDTTAELWEVVYTSKSSCHDPIDGVWN